MILPDNGKVVIIDDQLTEAFPLMTLLSREKVPFVYFQDEGGDDLPEQPLKNIRLIFLDLKLIASERSKDIISAIVSRLTRIISEENGPYILVVWSTHKSDYYNDLLNEFDTKLKKYKPILITSLPKTAYLKTENGQKVLKSRESLAKISNVLKDKLNKKDSMYPFLYWENLINTAAGDTTNTFTSFFDFDSNGWNKNIKNVLYKIAKAYAGKTIDKTPPDEIRQIKSALFTLNHSMIDSAENYIAAIQESDALKGKVLELAKQDTSFAATINRKLLVSDEKERGLVPGNVYILEKTNLSAEKSSYFKIILNGSIDRHKLPIFFKDELSQAIKGKRGLERKKDQRKFIEKKFSEIKKEIFDKGKAIELHVSPVCDYAQNKLELGRILPGIMIKEDYCKYIDTRPLYNYTTVGFTVGKESYFLLFDFRFLFAMTKTELQGIEPTFRIKQQLLTDIQIQLSSHVNRPGVIFVE